jgi:plastocyanin
VNRAVPGWNQAREGTPEKLGGKSPDQSARYALFGAAAHDFQKEKQMPRGLKPALIPALIPALFILALGATTSVAQTPDWSQAKPLTIELSSFKFTPSAETLQHGTVYKIHFVNKSSGGHDFVAKEFFAGSMVAPEDRAKLTNGGIDVEGGGSVDVRLIPNKTGSFKVHCSHFMHSSFGMTGTITVQ